MNYHVFLRWGLMAVLSIIGLLVAMDLGLIYEMFEHDATKLSLLIVGAYMVMTAICGKQSYKLARLMHDKEIGQKLAKNSAVILDKFTDSEMDEIRRNEKTGWFMAAAFFSIGMIGTIIGFMMAFHGLGDLDIANTADVRAFMGHMTEGITTALITTLAGLICGLLLKFQYYNLAYVRSAIDKMTEKNEGE